MFFEIVSVIIIGCIIAIVINLLTLIILSDYETDMGINEQVEKQSFYDFLIFEVSVLIFSFCVAYEIVI